MFAHKIFAHIMQIILLIFFKWFGFNKITSGSGALDAVRPVRPWPHHFFFAKEKREEKVKLCLPNIGRKQEHFEKKSQIK